MGCVHEHAKAECTCVSAWDNLMHISIFSDMFEICGKSSYVVQMSLTFKTSVWDVFAAKHNWEREWVKK